MKKEFSVRERVNKSNLAFVDILAENGIAFSWLEGFSEDMEDKFGYVVIKKIDGFDEAIWHLENGDNRVMVVYEEMMGIEIHPEHKQAEEDVKKMGVYLKEFLENLSDE